MTMSKTGLIRTLSLKSRMAIAVVVLVWGTAVLVNSVSLFLSKQGMKVAISEQQATLLDKLAEEIDQKIMRRQTSLQSLALNIPENAVTDANALQRYLEQHADIKVFFDNLTVFNAKGELIASLRGPADPVRINVADRQYFKDALRTGQSNISLPFISSVTNEPVVVFATARVDGSGTAALVVAGTIDLMRNSFIAQIGKSKIGRSGYLYVATLDSILVIHPTASRVLEDMQARGKRLFWSDSVEGSTDAIGQSGERNLFSFKRLTSVPWVIGSVLPESETFAPIANLEQNLIVAAAMLALLMGPLAWWFIRRQIEPLQKLQNRIHIIRNDPTHAILPASYADDEIGELASAFDNLIRERIFAEAKYQASAEELRAATNGSLDAFWILQSERDERGNLTGFVFRYLNRLAEQHLGLGQQSMIGHTTQLTYITDPAFADINGPCASTGGPGQVCAPRKALPETTLYIPLLFWFCRNPGLALPLVALTSVGQKSIRPKVYENYFGEYSFVARNDFFSHPQMLVACAC